MDINASIIDQRLTGIIEQYPEFFVDYNDANKKRSTAFVMLCISLQLDITLNDAYDLLTDGGNDAGVDGIFVHDATDGECDIILFQGKYKINNLDGQSNFPANDVEKAITTARNLFDPQKNITLNPKILPKIEEIRSLIRDGIIPKVTFILCNNGQKWNNEAQSKIEQSGLSNQQLMFHHLNHDNLIELLRKTHKVSDNLTFSGESVVESFNLCRVLIGKVRVSEIHRLFKAYGDNLLQRNIRRYLGMQNNSVNTAIHNTLLDPQKRENFYFFNNGITMICSKFKHNEFQEKNRIIPIENMQIINGGQTCKTIYEALQEHQDLLADYQNTFVMVKIYELDETDNVTSDITYATNSQNPVDLSDLRSNDEIQKQLEIGMKDLGYIYKRQKDDNIYGSDVLTKTVVAESVLAIWRELPHFAKFKRKEHFGVLYERIFKNLTPAEAIIAVLIYRMVENERKRPTGLYEADFIPYASHYIAMIIGHLLSGEIENITHRNFIEAKTFLEDNFKADYKSACEVIEKALFGFYGERDISLQQLSATFRRGDLLEFIDIDD